MVSTVISLMSVLMALVGSLERAPLLRCWPALMLIIRRLNEVTMNGRRWHAQPSPCLGSGSYEALLKTREGQEWLQLESERMLSKVENALKELVVDVEDLQELVKVNRRYMELTKNSGD